MSPVHFDVWYDYLCPWCFNGAVRLARLEAEFEGRVALTWRAYLLRPFARPGRDLERFRAYTRSWSRPAAEADAGTFRAWQGDAGPPRSSVPAHCAAKAAAALGRDAFARLHARLLRAYFAESRDVSERETLTALWQELRLPLDALEPAFGEVLERAVRAEHDDAVAAGVTGVPAVRKRGNDAVIVGAQPLELYRRWTQRALDGRA